MSDRCTGHCCRAFPLPYSLEEIRRRVEEKRRDPDCVGLEDGEQILDMLVPLGAMTAWPDGRPFEPAGERHVFTCRHLDDATGNCGVYATRPRMCADYPYGVECDQPECTAPARGRDFVPVARLQWSAR